MAEVIELSIKRAERLPHLAGPAICGVCGHEWQAVAPVGTVHLDCPRCDRLFGTFKNAVEPDEAWRCTCGEMLFWMTRDGSMCRRCGSLQSGF